MPSLARAHRARMEAARRQQQAADASLAELIANATPYELQRAALGNCLAELKNIQSTEAKIERKRAMLPDFEPWCDGVLAAAEAAGDNFVATHDDVVVQVLIWQIDVGNFAKALPLAGFVLRHGLALPERFKRTAATMVAEEIAEAGLKAAGQGEAFPLDVLQEAAELTADEDMPDQVRAKLHKAIGLELARQAEAIDEKATDGAAGGKRAAIAAALAELKRATALHAKAGVKKEIERLERELKKPETQE